MDKRDRSVFQVIHQHELVILGTVGTFFVWIVVMIFSLKEAQAVNQSDIKYIRESVDKIYDQVK